VRNPATRALDLFHGWDSLSWSKASGWKLTRAPPPLFCRASATEGQPHGRFGEHLRPCGPPERPSPRGDGVLRRRAQGRARPDGQVDRDRPRCRCIGGHLGGDSSPQPPSPPPAGPGPCPGPTPAVVTHARLAPLPASHRRDGPFEREGSNRRKDALHKLSRRLVVENDLIVHEDLKSSNMSRSAKGTVDNPGHNVAAKSGLNDAIMDSSWARLISMITCKAEDAGRRVVAVNPGTRASGALTAAISRPRTGTRRSSPACLVATASTRT